jgi:YfiH family protein
MFSMRRVGDLSVLQTDLFPLSLAHGFATKKPASRKPGGTQGEDADFRIDSLPSTARWWIRLRNTFFTPDHLCIINLQVHGGKVRVVSPDNLEGEELEAEGFKYRVPGDGDAIVKPFTRKPMFLAITTADCLPCLVYDRESHSVGVVHAGWRGLAADIPASAIRAFKKDLGSKVKDLLWAVGPSIDVDNYQVGPEVIGALEAAGYAESDWESSRGVAPGWVRERRGDRYRLNLAACLKIRLLNQGISEDRMDICALSTFGNPNLFYSYRRDGGIRGLNATFIG